MREIAFSQRNLTGLITTRANPEINQTLGFNSEYCNMKINANFNERVVIRPSDYKWQPSPMPNVERMMLDRIGDEVARATSIVKYGANSEFPRHTHVGGEEILVLEGIFADEFGEYPAGTYLRNPIGTSHTPKVGQDGATIMVKLCQFDDLDTQQVCLDTNKNFWQQGIVPGLQVMTLHQFEHEHVALVKWQPNTQFSQHRHWGGEEIFVISGTFHDEHGIYPSGTWIRSPHQSIHTPFTLDDGALIYVKTGHLMDDMSKFSALHEQS